MKFSKLILFLFLFCCNPYEDVASHKWKYVEGYHIGDVIGFQGSNRYNLDKEGLIYLQGLHKGAIVKQSYRELTIESVKGEIGVYILFD